MDETKILFILGPTAVGKSYIALQVAKHISGEIITCDSMQVYQGLDICTDKPDLEMRRLIPHHLTDVTGLDKEYSVNDWRSRALEIIPQIINRGSVPIVTGGTGLYYRSLVKGLFPGPGADWALRQQLMEEARTTGPDSLYQRLREIDQNSAESINPNDIRRIIRALEIYYLSGQSKSDLVSQTQGLPSKYRPVAVCLDMPRPVLYQRINQRVDYMWQSGLVEEIKGLAGHSLSRSVVQIIGYKEVKGYLEGLYSEQEARRLMARNTRRLAKRQMSLFRQEKEIQWIKLSPETFSSGEGHGLARGLRSSTCPHSLGSADRWRPEGSSLDSAESLEEAVSQIIAVYNQAVCFGSPL